MYGKGMAPGAFLTGGVLMATQTSAAFWTSVVALLRVSAGALVMRFRRIRISGPTTMA